MEYTRESPSCCCTERFIVTVFIASFLFFQLCKEGIVLTYFILDLRSEDHYCSFKKATHSSTILVSGHGP
jgi:hypothetical protein